MDMNALGKPVERYGPPRHIRHFRLNFKRFKAGVRLFLAEQKRQNARAGAHVRDPFTGTQPGEIGKQHRIHAEAKGAWMLDDVQPVPLQIIQAFAGLEQAFGHGSTSR